MPPVEQEVTYPGRYLLRHIAPEAAAENTPGIVSPIGTGFAVLAQTLYAQPLPVSHLPSSPDFHEGTYTLRLGDAGDFKLSFPNRDASVGQPWRTRFSANGHTEFIEISREGNVEFIGVIVKIEKDRQKITVEGFDAFFLLKKAYEQEYTAVMAPRDLIERYTEPAVVNFATQFKAATLAENGFGETGTAGLEVSLTSKGVLCRCPGGNKGIRSGISSTEGLVARAGRWSVRVQITLPAVLVEPGGIRFWLTSGGGSEEKYTLQVLRATGGAGVVVGVGSTGSGGVSGGGYEVESVAAGGHTLLLECDGRWIFGYFDGRLVGIIPANLAAGGELKAHVEVFEGSAPPIAMYVTEVVVRKQRPFLLRGSAKGVYVLPGTASSYPTGGLHGRYLVNGATSTAEKWWETILAPDPRRTGFPEFLQDQQAVINSPKPDGVPESYWAARWFGAVYLKLSNVTYGISVAKEAKCGLRLWVGKTQMGQQLIDEWFEATGVRPEGAVNASTLEGADGWYPIILEAFIPNVTSASVILDFVASSSYTDPGGTVIPASTLTNIPTTSLSPLGCVDARIQGSSFFDLVQEIAKNFGYQFWCEPKQLESGEFPGQIVPKLRVGRETDEIVEPDDIDRKSTMDNYTQTLDATDSATSVKAFGSGIADGKGSQIAFEAVSIPDEAADLFDLQAWCAAGDIAFPELLAARAEAELSLRRGVWENLTGAPIARDRLADTFPLTGVLSLFRWRPGDGVRLILPDINVLDTVPRAILQVERQFGPDGRIVTQVGFRARPKDPLYALRTALREATRPARAYQKQYVTRPGPITQSGPIAASGFGPYAILALTPMDKVLAASLILVGVGSALATGVEINGVDRTSELGGPWTSPVTINILPYVLPHNALTDQRFYLRVKNNSASEQSGINYQFILTLLV